MCPYPLEATWGGEERDAMAHPLPGCAQGNGFPSLRLNLHFSRRNGSAWLTSQEEDRTQGPGVTAGAAPCSF